MTADERRPGGEREPPEAKTARTVVLTGLGLLVGGLLTVAVLTAVRSPAPRDLAITASPVPTPGDGAAAGVVQTPRGREDDRAQETEDPPNAPPPSAGPAGPDGSAAPGPGDDQGATTSPSRTPDARAADAFAADFDPPSGTKRDSLTADVDNDGIPDVVIASLVSRTVRIDLATWTGQQYAVVFTGQGGPADTLDDLSVADFNGDGAAEVVTVQAVGSVGESLSIWGTSAAGLSPQRATGGCADGRHVFGVAGAQITSGRILASCDGSPLPPDAWPVDEYRWDGTRWAYQTTTDITAGDLRNQPAVPPS